jgi:hypothetical protein
MYEEAKKKIISARTPKDLAEAIKPLLTHAQGPMESKKLIDMARHAAVFEIHPNYPSFPKVPKDCDLQTLLDWCNSKEQVL